MENFSPAVRLKGAARSRRKVRLKALILLESLKPVAPVDTSDGLGGERLRTELARQFLDPAPRTISFRGGKAVPSW